MPKKIRTIGTDAVSTKTLKANLNSMVFEENGGLSQVYIDVSYHEVGGAEVIPTGTEPQIKSKSRFLDIINAYSLSILSTTRIYSPLVDVNNVPIPNAITIKDYIDQKHLNTYSVSVNSNSATSLVIEAILQEIIEIKQANGEYPL